MNYYNSEGIQILLNNGELERSDLERLVAIVEQDFDSAGASCRVLETAGGETPLDLHSQQSDGESWSMVYLREEYAKLKPENVFLSELQAGGYQFAEGKNRSVRIDTLKNGRP